MFVYRGWTARRDRRPGFPRGLWTVTDGAGRVRIRMGGSRREVRLEMARYMRAHGGEDVPRSQPNSHEDSAEGEKGGERP